MKKLLRILIIAAIGCCVCISCEKDGPEGGTTIGSMEDLREFEELSGSNLDFTIGSALDIFGGTLPYEKIKDLLKIISDLENTFEGRKFTKSPIDVI